MKPKFLKVYEIIAATHPSMGGTETKRVKLYCWSDGVVTWTMHRTDATND